MSIFFAQADILNEKSPYFGKHLFAKQELIARAKLCGQDFATGKNFSFNQCHTKSYFIKAIENFFPVFAYPDINTRGVGRIRDSYANPRRTPLVFISGYANTENVFYCLIGVYIINRTLHGLLKTRNLSSRVQKYFLTLEDKFRIFSLPGNILYLPYELLSKRL